MVGPFLKGGVWFVRQAGGEGGARMYMSPSPEKQNLARDPLGQFLLQGVCRTLRTDTAKHCKRKGVRGEDWAALDHKTHSSGLDKIALASMRAPPGQASAKAYSREEELDLVLRSSCPTHASLRR